MKKVLVVGSLNMDYTIYMNNFPLRGETIYGSSRFIQPGGKGENQAVALAKSHLVNVSMLGAVGDDGDGKEIASVLSTYGVENKLVVKKGIETGNASILVSSDSENEIIIIPGANGELKPSDIDVSLIKNSDYIVLQNEIPQETNEFVMKEAKKEGKIVIYNPAPFREFDSSLFKYVDFFVPNEVELSKYALGNTIEEQINYVLDKGAKSVLVTLGTKGSNFVSKDENIHVDCFKVKAIDTVAAGDTYVGYFTAGLATDLSIKDAMILASKASSITVTRKGSVVSIPFGEECK